MAWVNTVITAVDSIPKRFNLYFAADFQLGSESTDGQIIRNWVRKVAADPNAMWCLLGDIEDDDRPTTRIMRKGAFAGRKEVIASDAKKHRAWINQSVLPILQPLTQRPCLGVLGGHHFYDLGDMTSTQWICHALTASGKNKVPYLGQMSSWVRTIFRHREKQSAEKLFHIQHGVGGGGTLASALNRLEKTAQGFHADVYVRAHDCKLVSGKYDILAPLRHTDGKAPKLQHKTISLMNIGSATRGYEMTLNDPNYAEMGMMRPQTLGWGVAHVQLFKQSRVFDPGQKFTAEVTLEI